MSNASPLNDIEKLDQAWKGIGDAISTLGEKIRKVTATEDALHRYEAYKAALAIIADNYASQFHFDRQRPESLPSVSPIFNWGATNPDFTYRVMHIEPGGSYRVWGRRGDSELIDMQQMIGWFGHAREAGKPTSMTVANEVFEAKNIKLDAQANFDFILSPDPREGQWWKLEAGVDTLLLRDYFTDYATQGRATTFHIDRLGAKDQGNTVPDMGDAAARLEALARALQDQTMFVVLPKPADGAEINRYKELNFGSVAGAADQRYFQARFSIRPGQALIGKWAVPKDYMYWGITLYSDAYLMLNIMNRQTNLNHALARVGADKAFYFVISHEDPGVANWLDVDGHDQGMVMLRTKGCLSPEVPSLQLVPMDQVLQHLPRDIAMVSASERQSTLAHRRRHYQLRENC